MGCPYRFGPEKHVATQPLIPYIDPNRFEWEASLSEKKFLKRSATLALSISLLAFSFTHSQTAVQLHGQLHVQGTHILDKNNQVVQFRGMALYWSNSAQSKYYTGATVKWIRDDWHCNIVRASMGMRPLGGTAGYIASPAVEKAKVDSVVQAAIALGMYVVIDWHETANGNDYLAESKDFFTKMATAYHSYPNVIYELWNEPLNTHPWATVIKPYHEAIIPVIRAIDPNNLILCGSKSWDQDVDEASKNPITISTNIIYTLHFYAATHKQSLRDKADTAIKYGLPLMVTEGGLSSSSGNGTIDTAEMRRWVNFMDQRGISWMNWSVAGLTETSAALTSAASGSGNWTTAQISGSGTWVRNEIRAKNAAVTAIFTPRKFSSRGLAPGLEIFDLRGDRVGATGPSTTLRDHGLPLRDAALHGPVLFSIPAHP